MSLTKCPSCNNSCSTLAVACPWCNRSLSFDNTKTSESKVKTGNSTTSTTSNKPKLFGTIGIILLFLSFPTCFVINESGNSSYEWAGYYNDAGARCGTHKITREFRCGYDSDGLLIWGVLFIAGLGGVIASSLINQNQQNLLFKQESSSSRGNSRQTGSNNSSVNITYKEKSKNPFKFKKSRSSSLIKRWKREIKKYGD